jgi:Arc/MetJ-type ribon-helix-helix transcriptional regulator
LRKEREKLQIPISNFRIPEELKERMKKAVREGRGKSLADIVRKALEKYLENPS